jgi:cytochrome c
MDSGAGAAVFDANTQKYIYPSVWGPDSFNDSKIGACPIMVARPGLYRMARNRIR